MMLLIIIISIIFLSFLDLPHSFHQIHQFKREVTIQFSSQRGLLFNNGDVKAAKFFCNDLNIKEAKALLDDTRNLFNICWENAEMNVTKLDDNLQLMMSKAESFIGSNHVWNRIELTSAIEDIIRMKGGFVCILGGKSTGKSLVLEGIKPRYKEKVFLVDLRVSSNILSSLINEIRERQLRYKSTKLKDNLLRMVGTFLLRWIPGMTTSADTDFQALFDSITKRQDADLSSILSELTTAFKGITLIVDEANIALTITGSTNPAEIKAAKDALAAFTRLTKKLNKARSTFSSLSYSYYFICRI